MKSYLISNGIKNDDFIAGKWLLANDDGGLDCTDKINDILKQHDDGYIAITFDKAKDNSGLVLEYSKNNNKANTAYYAIALFKCLQVGGKTGLTSGDQTELKGASEYSFHLGWSDFPFKKKKDVLFHAVFPIKKDEGGGTPQKPEPKTFCYGKSQQALVFGSTTILVATNEERQKEIARLHSLSPALYAQYLQAFWGAIPVPPGFSINWTEMDELINHPPDPKLQLRFRANYDDKTNNQTQVFYSPDTDVPHTLLIEMLKKQNDAKLSSQIMIELFEVFTRLIDIDYTFDLMNGIHLLHAGSLEMRFYKGISSAGETLLIESIDGQNGRQYFDLNALHP